MHNNMGLKLSQLLPSNNRCLHLTHFGYPVNWTVLDLLRFRLHESMYTLVPFSLVFCTQCMKWRLNGDIYPCSAT